MRLHVGNPADSIQSSDFSGGACIWFCRGCRLEPCVQAGRKFWQPLRNGGSLRDTAQTEKTRPKVFRLGLIFSMGLTLLPAIILSLTWAMRSIR